MKTLKWIYELGIKHERRRIKLLIAEHRYGKPNRDDYPTVGDFRKQEAMWYEVGYALDRLTNPVITETREISLIDEEV